MYFNNIVHMENELSQMVSDGSYYDDKDYMNCKNLDLDFPSCTQHRISQNPCVFKRVVFSETLLETNPYFSELITFWM